MKPGIKAVAIGSAFSIVAALASPGWAEPDPYPGGVVVAQSQIGNGTISAPVRQTALGYEVRLPGGNWIACKRDCAETLRVETVDFWEAQNGLAKECGVFGCLKLQYPR